MLIVDDHPIVCQGLQALIDAQDDFSVCGVAEDVAGALDTISREQPDIAIVDLNLKGGDGLELIKARRGHELPILVLSMHEEGLYAERAIRAGAKGYLMKQEASDKVIDALRCVLAGELFVSDTLRSRLLESSDPQTASDPMADLSDRELQIFRLIGMGHGTPSNRREPASEHQDDRVPSSQHQAETGDQVGAGAGASSRPLQ